LDKFRTGQRVASSNELIDVTAGVLAVNRSTCATIFRELRSAGLISNEGRGRHSAAMTARDAATFVLAICAAERVQDAADAVERYSSLVGSTGRRESMVIPSSSVLQTLKGVIPRLGSLPPDHTLIDALIAIVESYVETASPRLAAVTVSFRGPYPWASIEIAIKRGAKEPVTIFYSDDGDEHGPGELALIDETKARQRRKFVALGGDLNVTATISTPTFARLGALLR
jgi:hypothetical protein